MPTTRAKLPLVLSGTALAVAVLGTTPLAAIAQNAVFPKGSVGTRQLQHNAVTAGKLAPDAVRGGHVLDGTLLSADFKPGQLPQGPKGDKGDKGDRGEKGDPGATTVVVRRSEDTASSGASTGVFVVALCEPGERVVAGGVAARAPVQINGSQPRPTTGSGSTPVGWEGTFSWPAITAAGARIVTSVICAKP